MSEANNYHMTPQQFRKYGRAVVDWIADYYGRVETLPVLSRVEPGQIRSSLPVKPPQKSEAFEDILKDMTELIIPGVTHWQSSSSSRSSTKNIHLQSIIRSGIHAEKEIEDDWIQV